MLAFHRRGEDVQLDLPISSIRPSIGTILCAERWCCLRPQSHLLYGEDKAAVRPLNLQKRVAAAEKLRWPQGGPTLFCNILQVVGSPWNEIALLNIFFISTLAVAI